MEVNRRSWAGVRGLDPVAASSQLEGAGALVELEGRRTGPYAER